VVAGATLTDDFRNAVRTSGNQPGAIIMRNGMIVHDTSTTSVSNASDAFILGPKIELMLSKRLSVEAAALYRAIRSTTSTTAVWSPPLEIPDGRIIETLQYSSTGTEFTWEFPVLAKYRFSVPGAKPFIEIGPSFRPAENREQFGMTFGTGVELRRGSLNFTPAVRYIRWMDNPKYLGQVHNQFQFLVGVDRPSSTSMVSALGHKVSLGVVAGWSPSDGLRPESQPYGPLYDPFYRIDYPVGSTQYDSVNRTGPIAGVQVAFELPKNFALEVGGMYVPLNAQDFITLPAGTLVRDGNLFTVLTWQFPILAKRKFEVGGAKPFVELGPSFRASGNLNGALPSRVGATAGLGIETFLRGMRVSPTVRYTRWAPDRKQSGRFTNLNRLELLVGLSF